MILKQDVTAYNNSNIYNSDLDIVLRDYPMRIIEITARGAGSEKYLAEMSLLELGIGHGYSTETLSNLFMDHTVIDADRELIKKYQDSHPESKVKFEQAFFEEYDTCKKYDVIVMGFVLEHVDDPPAIMKKYSGFLSNVGRMFLTVPNAQSLHRRFANAAGVLDDMNRLSETDIRFGHKRYYTKESLELDIEKAGLNQVRMEGVWLKPFTTSQIMSLNLDERILRNGMCQTARAYPELAHSILAEIKK